MSKNALDTLDIRATYFYNAYMDSHYSEHTIIHQLNPEQIAANVRAYFNKVYTWLALSMALSAGAAVYLESDLLLMQKVVDNFFMLSLLTLGIVVVMCFAANKLTSGALKVLLLVYSLVQGALFSPLLLVYTNESLGLTFACTAGMFAIMAIYGRTTRRNLSGLGRTLMMVLIGLIIAMIANRFFGNSMVSLGICAVGIVVFALFTAYDFQQLQAEGAMLVDPVDREKGAILGALGLYINFYNMFRFLLHFLGNADE